ncbi:MAG TPA: hypothetical protein ACFYD6_08500 [Candidatus Brocadiia bacterium]|nr:hypothetical protein [Planctomycetota bacterium]
MNRDKECDKEFVTVLQEINRLSLKVNCEPFRLKFSGYREEYTEQPSWVNSWRDDVPLGRKNKPYAVEITNGYSCREAYSLAGFKTPTEAESEATKQLVKYRKTLFPAQAGKGGKIASTFKKVWKLVATGIALTILILRELHFFEWLWEKMHWMWD